MSIREELVAEITRMTAYEHRLVCGNHQDRLPTVQRHIAGLLDQLHAIDEAPADWRLTAPLVEATHA